MQTALIRVADVHARAFATAQAPQVYRSARRRIFEISEPRCPLFGDPYRSVRRLRVWAKLRLALGAVNDSENAGCSNN